MTLGLPNIVENRLESDSEVEKVDRFVIDFESLQIVIHSPSTPLMDPSVNVVPCRN